MGEAIFSVIVLTLLITATVMESSCYMERFRGDLIKEHGFCVSKEVSGIKFEKCYEVVERKKPAEDQK